jgi:hypothetical protein
MKRKEEFVDQLLKLQDIINAKLKDVINLMGNIVLIKILRKSESTLEDQTSRSVSNFRHFCLVKQSSSEGIR